MTETQGVNDAASGEKSREVYDTYVGYRDHLIAHEFESSRDRDKWLLSISGGGLALSITFVSDVVAPDSARYPPILLIGWACLILSVVACLFSMQTGLKAYKQYRHIADKEGANGFAYGYWERVRKNQLKVAEAKKSEKQSITSFWLLAIGFACLGTFVWINMG